MDQTIEGYYKKKYLQDYYSKLVKEDPANLKFVPEEYRSKKMCTRAIIKSDMPLIQFVPEDKLTEEMCSLSIRKNVAYFSAIPDHFKTYKLCLELVTLDGDMLSLVPDIHKTFELCDKALETNTIQILSNIPYKYRYYMICDKAVEKDWNEFKYVPYKHRDYKLCLKAFEKAPTDTAREEIVKLVPEDVRRKKPFRFRTDSMKLTKDILENCDEVYKA